MAYSLAAIAARRATNLTRPSLIQRRTFSASSDPNAIKRVNIWEAPMNPRIWKEEHFVIVSLSGWGLAIYGGYKFFTRNKNKKVDDTQAVAA